MVSRPGQWKLSIGKVGQYWNERDQMDMWIFRQRRKGNAERRKVLWLETVSLAISKDGLDMLL